MLIALHITLSSGSHHTHGHRQQNQHFIFFTMEERFLSSTQKPRLIKSLPSGIKGAVEDGGWQIVMPRNTSSTTIMTEEGFLNK
jgi:hypothetical protein